MGMQEQGQVSCRHVRWLFELCKHRRIPEKHLLNHVPTPRAELMRQDGHVDWETFVMIYANIGSWLAQEALIEEAALAWRHPDFSVWLARSALYRNPREQITSQLTSPGGLLGSLPVRPAVSQPHESALLVELEFLPESVPPDALLVALAGQLAALPGKLGGHPAELTIPAADTPRFELWLTPPGRLGTLRHAINLPLHARELAAESQHLFDLLIAQHQSLRTLRQDAVDNEAATATLRGELTEARSDLSTVARQLEQTAAREAAIERDFDNLSSRLSEAVIRTSTDRTIVSFNEATTTIFDCEPEFLRGAAIDSLIPGAKAMTGNTPTEIDATTRRGVHLRLEITALESGGDSRLWVVRDLTSIEQGARDRTLLQQQLQAAQRVESLGELTGGIAHDFNNILVAINGFADLILGRPDLDETVREYIDEIRRAGDRATGMTRKLLAYARRQESIKVEVDLNRVIRDSEGIIRRLLPATINVRFLPSLQAPLVMADPGQLEQVIINLCVNARDAMPDGGNLTIAIGQRRRKDRNGDPEEVATITIEDTGTGIDPELMDKIFEPFYTTKDAGNGTGLGLSVVFGIIKSHGGLINVDSEPGRGTKFEILLPTATLERVAEPEPTPAPEPAEPAFGDAVILLIEDNDQVRKLCEKILQNVGYEVLSAADGDEGLRRFRDNADRIDLVIVDVVMPRRGGREVFEAIREQRSDVPVLFSTGYSTDAEEVRFARDQGLDIIEKPYTPEKLSSRVRNLLNAD